MAWRFDERKKKGPRERICSGSTHRVIKFVNVLGNQLDHDWIRPVITNRPQKPWSQLPLASVAPGFGCPWPRLPLASVAPGLGFPWPRLPLALVAPGIGALQKFSIDLKIFQWNCSAQDENGLSTCSKMKIPLGWISSCAQWNCPVKI